MIRETHSKVEARHLKSDAYLYVRQSTLRQVVENQESTLRQYALRQRAIALGWPADRIVVVDCDLGQSGSAEVDREGFERLVTEVGMGRAGIVMGLEVSRLARNSADWHRLLEICALTGTLILDEDGIYDPAHFNDRLLLGLKGTMSEAELHVLRARLRGGILNKARRGELAMKIPIGYAYDTNRRLRFDPDARIQDRVRHLFQTFRRTGSALATVKVFREEKLHFPRRVLRGPNNGEVIWAPLLHSQTLRILHNPRYSGAFVYGKSRYRRAPDGRFLSKKVPREEWLAYIPGAHEAYVTPAEFEENLRLLQENAMSRGADRSKGAVREGSALLQGLVVCATCGLRMTIRYKHRGTRASPVYACQRRGIENGLPICQHIFGVGLDEAIGKLLIDSVTPVAIEVALKVQKEIEGRSDEAERLRG